MFNVRENNPCFVKDGISYYSVKEVANMINHKKQFGRNKIFQLLRDNDIIWGSSNIYPDYRDAFCFEEAQTNGYCPHKTKVFTTLRVSDAGIKIIKVLIESKLCKTKNECLMKIQ